MHLRILTSILSSGGNPRIWGLKRFISVVSSAPKSLTLPTSVRPCGHSHCTQLSLLSHQENCGDGKYLGLCCRPEHGFSRNQLLGASDWVPLLIPSQFRSDCKPLLLMHSHPHLSDPLSPDSMKRLRLQWSASYRWVCMSMTCWNPIQRITRRGGMEKSELHPLFQRLRYRCGLHSVAPIKCIRESVYLGHPYWRAEIPCSFLLLCSPWGLMSFVYKMRESHSFPVVPFILGITCLL